MNNTQQTDTTNVTLINVTAEIVAAYVSNNPVGVAELPALIQKIYSTIQNISEGIEVEGDENLKPAVPAKKSIFPDYIICLEDGQKFKSLKRHLMTHYKITPDEYRAKWGLASDYPMVAPNYAKARSDLAKKIGLGQHPKTAEGRKRRQRVEEFA